MRSDFLQYLDVVKQLTEKGKIHRFLHVPFRMIKALIHRKLFYSYGHNGWLQHCRLFTGDKITVLLPAATDLYLFGAKSHHSEIRLSKFICRELMEGQTFIDVGAHYGYFSLLAAALTGKKGKIVAFEPSSNAFKLLSKNTASHSNISVINKVVCERVGIVDFYEFPVIFSEFNAIDIDEAVWKKILGNVKAHKTKIETTTIDCYCSSENLIPDMIKIDVEGAELSVVEGMKTTLLNHSPIVLMEYIPKKDTENDPHKKAVIRLKEWGYLPHVIEDSGELSRMENPAEYFEGHYIDSDNLVFKKTKSIR